DGVARPRFLLANQGRESLSLAQADVGVQEMRKDFIGDLDSTEVAAILQFVPQLVPTSDRLGEPTLLKLASRKFMFKGRGPARFRLGFDEDLKRSGIVRRGAGLQCAQSADDVPIVQVGQRRSFARKNVL